MRLAAFTAPRSDFPSKQITWPAVPKVEADFGAIHRKHLTVTGSTLRGRNVAQKATIISALREKVWPLWDREKLRTSTYRRFPINNPSDRPVCLSSADPNGSSVTRHPDSNADWPKTTLS